MANRTDFLRILKAGDPAEVERFLLEVRGSIAFLEESRVLGRIADSPQAPAIIEAIYRALEDSTMDSIKWLGQMLGRALEDSKLTSYLLNAHPEALYYIFPGYLDSYKEEVIWPLLARRRDPAILRPLPGFMTDYMNQVLKGLERDLGSALPSDLIGWVLRAV